MLSKFKLFQQRLMMINIVEQTIQSNQVILVSNKRFLLPTFILLVGKNGTSLNHSQTSLLFVIKYF